MDPENIASFFRKGVDYAQKNPIVFGILYLGMLQVALKMRNKIRRRGEYPYIKGKGGIDFSSLPDTTPFEGIKFRGASGRLLHYISDGELFQVTDEKYPDVLMSVEFETPNTVMFNLQTKLPGRALWEMIRTRHPDFFARRFVERFIRLHPEVQKIRACWSDGSDNLLMFHKAYRKTKNLEKSALSTWSGKTFSSLGFTRVLSPANLEDLRFDRGITLMFVRG